MKKQQIKSPYNVRNILKRDLISFLHKGKDKYPFLSGKLNKRFELLDVLDATYRALYDEKIKWLDIKNGLAK